MHKQVPSPEDEEAEKIWRVAETARHLAMRAALRDKTLWGNQSLSLACGVVKAVCIAIALSVGLALGGVPQNLCILLAMLIVGPFVAFNPKSFFWRNLFTEHANSAFDYAVKNYPIRNDK